MSQMSKPGEAQQVAQAAVEGWDWDSEPAALRGSAPVLVVPACPKHKTPRSQGQTLVLPCLLGAVRRQQVSDLADSTAALGWRGGGASMTPVGRHGTKVLADFLHQSQGTIRFGLSTISFCSFSSFPCSWDQHPPSPPEFCYPRSGLLSPLGLRLTPPHLF